MTTHKKHYCTITLRSNYENRYELNLDKIWETIKAHYESQNIPNIYLIFQTKEHPHVSSINLCYCTVAGDTRAYSLTPSRILPLRSHVMVEDLIQKINQYIDKKI